MRIDIDRIKSYSTRGFTLIEMLLVVSIISILISLLLPSLREADDEAQKSVCQSNLRIILGGYHSYSRSDSKRLIGSNTGRDPWDWVGSGNSVNAVQNFNNGNFFQHVGSLDAYQCPDQVYSNYVNSYALNGMLNGERKSHGIGTKRHWTKSMVDSKQIVLFEEDDYRGSNINSFIINETQGHFVDLPAANHSLGDNIGFLDGHVEYWEWQTADMRTRPKHGTTGITFHHQDSGSVDWDRIREGFRTWPGWDGS